METEGRSGCRSFATRAIVIAVVVVLAAKLINRLHPELLPRLKDRMTRCCCGSEGMRACMEKCGCGKVAEPEAEAAPAAEPAPVD
jgi:hypothetical protein